MILSMIGPWQFILIFVFIFGIFFLGYYLGKKSGYIKRVKEVEKKGWEILILYKSCGTLFWIFCTIIYIM